jgi:hypothetical protein
MTNDTLHSSLVSYGKVLNIQAEMWSKANKYPVSNRVRQVSIHLTRHPLSHLAIAGQRVRISYEGQPSTCYGCGEVGHLYQACPERQTTGTERQDPYDHLCIHCYKASPSGRQLVDTNPTVGQKGVKCNTVNATTATTVSDRETDTSMTDMEPPLQRA